MSAPRRYIDPKAAHEETGMSLSWCYEAMGVILGRSREARGRVMVPRAAWEAFFEHYTRTGERLTACAPRSAARAPRTGTSTTGTRRETASNGAPTGRRRPTPPPSSSSGSAKPYAIPRN